MVMRNDPLQSISKLVKDRYKDAKAVFWGGSLAQNRGTESSDLDLIIVFAFLPHAYREAFMYDGWKIDAFINDPNTLSYFFEQSRSGNGICGLAYMIVNGREIMEPTAFSNDIKKNAENILKIGPSLWDQNYIDRERFLITDALDDIIYPVSREEQVASAAWLLEALGQFYFRSQGKWCASGKSIIRYLYTDNPELATEFTKAFDRFFTTRDISGIEGLVQKILMPYGGLLWEGFRFDSII